MTESNSGSDKGGGNETRMDRLVKWAQIFSWLAVPLIVLWITVHVQHQTTRAGIGRDLIQTAIQVLKDPARPETADIRDWAVKTVNQYSDVKLTEKASSQLSRGALAFLHSNPLLQPAMAERSVTCPKIDTTSLSHARAAQIDTLFAACKRNADDRLWLRTFIGLISGSP